MRVSVLSKWNSLMVHHTESKLKIRKMDNYHKLTRDLSVCV